MSTVLNPPGSLSEEVRRRLKAYMDSTHCLVCGHENQPVSMRRLARETGTPHSTLVRFMQGEVIYSDTLDALNAWLNGREL